MYDIPILLITFNRAEHTRRVLNEIKKQKPKKFYVFQDGVRTGRPDDVAKCEAVRKTIEQMVDWSCELYTNYSQENLGCGRGPYTAISWLLENEEYGIILEDDILPHALFFDYMEDALHRYKDEERVGMVTGHNYERHYSRSNSYYFTYPMTGTLGWGTWRRVWKDYDFDIPYNYEAFDRALWKYYGMPKPCREDLHSRYGRWLAEDRSTFWDCQFYYYLMLHGYLNVRPNSCLTNHEGYDDDAVHMKGASTPRYYMDIHADRLTPPAASKSHQNRYEGSWMYV